ncbi:MAG: glycosyltransferase family 4 protein [Hydrogenophilales bacterium]|nr:glycosyltransferase family 4 protein [Hydrogenophilales bacterium]
MSNRILLVSPASPFSPRSGAQQRTALLHEALRTRGDVDVLLIEPTAGPSRLVPPKPGILAHGYWHQRSFGIGKFKPDRALDLALRADGVDLTRYRLVVSRYLNPISKLLIPPDVRTVVDLDDWGYHYAPGALALAAQFKSRYAAWLAQRQLKRFDAYFFVSRRDQFRHLDLQSALLPNIPYSPPALPFPQTGSSTLLFVGSLWYAPNRKGIDRFLSRCWPLIKAACTHARLLLVGTAPPAVRQAWERHPGVSAPGFVDSLEDAYRNAAFTIAPIYSGGGTNIKILESLAYGRACVTTSHGADAFGADLENAGLAIVKDDAAFARQCTAWLTNIDNRRGEAEKGPTAIKRHFTRTVFHEQVALLCASPVRPG